MKHRAPVLAAFFCLLMAAEGAAAATPDPLLLLPPPPAAGSPRAQAELAEVHAFQATSTPEQLAAAAYDDQHENPVIFTAVLGPRFDLQALPATRHLMAEVSEAEEKTSGVAKTAFHRDRPWIVDPAIKTCTAHKPGPAANSYPSGHATIGFAMAVVLADLMPQKAQGLLDRAEQFAENRLVCGYHFRSDIVAGQQLGTALALDLMQDGSFAADMAAARTELHGAGLIP